MSIAADTVSPPGTVIPADQDALPAATEEQIRRVVAGAGSRKNDSEYLERSEQARIAYRKQVEEAFEREQAEGYNK